MTVAPSGFSADELRTRINRILVYLLRENQYIIAVYEYLPGGRLLDLKALLDSLASVVLLEKIVSKRENLPTRRRSIGDIKHVL